MKLLKGKNVSYLLTICLFVIVNTCEAEDTSGRLRAYVAQNWSGQTVYCQASYPVSACKGDTRALLGHLRGYPLSQLGAWTWVLVPSSEWRPMTQSLGLSPETPAFTSLTDRTTLIEQVLVSPDVRYGAELIRTFGMPYEELLELAISHEIGHGLCGFRDERRADLAGERLRNRETPYCEESPQHRVRVAFGKFPDILGGE